MSKAIDKFFLCFYVLVPIALIAGIIAPSIFLTSVLSLTCAIFTYGTMGDD